MGTPGCPVPSQVFCAPLQPLRTRLLAHPTHTAHGWDTRMGFGETLRHPHLLPGPSGLLDLSALNYCG